MYGDFLLDYPEIVLSILTTLLVLTIVYAIRNILHIHPVALLLQKLHLVEIEYDEPDDIETR